MPVLLGYDRPSRERYSQEKISPTHWVAFIKEIDK
jgi:hypothetical protein